MEDKTIESVIILGSGPAGLSAALYAARAELNPLVLTGMQLGGQAALTNVIENYPGFPDGVGGAALGDLLQKQAERFGARMEYDNVESVDLLSTPKRIKTYSKEYLANSVIIATGASSVKLNVPGEELLSGKGVSYCATCDGWFFKDKEVVVVGGGDSALEEALFLTRYATKVTIIHRRDQFRAGVLLQSRVHDNKKIQLVLDSVVKEIQGEDKVIAVLVENVKTGEKTQLTTDGVFVFIGHKPNNGIYQDQVEMDEHGYIKVNMKMETSVPGVFACGEAADPEYRQVATSVGMGAAAAIQDAKYLETLEK
ncbi:MAG TPA: thioredoxin-disulfide reductase [Anaerolineaceae bacterium]|nr:thioredoxin-disulfide reductase [Anaerolineaceae bacterium]